MKLEMRCPACEKSFLLDESSFGSELFCPVCMQPLPVDALRLSTDTAHAAPTVDPGRAAAPTEVTVPAAPPAPLSGTAEAVAAVTTEPVTQSTPSERPAEEEVVCPRCKLHFNSNRHTHDVEPGDRPTVLIVEDMGYFLEIAYDALSGHYDVKKATTLDQAKALLVDGGIDLVVLDLTLGEGDDGMKLLEGMAIKPCPILIFTARDESEMYGEGWEDLQKLGADDIVIKGMNAAELLRKKVAALLGRRWDDEEEIG